jgi:hypothetical protein
MKQELLEQSANLDAHKHSQEHHHDHSHHEHEHNNLGHEVHVGCSVHKNGECNGDHGEHLDHGHHDHSHDHGHDQLSKKEIGREVHVGCSVHKNGECNGNHGEHLDHGHDHGEHSHDHLRNSEVTREVHVGCSVHKNGECNGNHGEHLDHGHDDHSHDHGHHKHEHESHTHEHNLHKQDHENEPHSHDHLDHKKHVIPNDEKTRMSEALEESNIRNLDEVQRLKKEQAEKEMFEKFEKEFDTQEPSNVVVKNKNKSDGKKSKKSNFKDKTKMRKPINTGKPRVNKKDNKKPDESQNESVLVKDALDTKSQDISLDIALENSDEKGNESEFVVPKSESFESEGEYQLSDISEAEIENFTDDIIEQNENNAQIIVENITTDVEAKEINTEEATEAYEDTVDDRVIELQSISQTTEATKNALEPEPEQIIADTETREAQENKLISVKVAKIINDKLEKNQKHIQEKTSEIDFVSDGKTAKLEKISESINEIEKLLNKRNLSNEEVIKFFIESMKKSEIYFTDDEVTFYINSFGLKFIEEALEFLKNIESYKTNAYMTIYKDDSNLTLVAKLGQTAVRILAKYNYKTVLGIS